MATLAGTNVLALVKPNGERWVFLYDDSQESRDAMLEQLAKFACDPEYIFNWTDAAVLSQRVIANAASGLE